MSVQPPLSAGWARQLTSMPDPRDRLDALQHAELTVRSEVRKVLTGLAVEFDIERREIEDCDRRPPTLAGYLSSSA